MEQNKESMKALPPGRKAAWGQWAWVLIAVVIIGGGLYMLSHTKPIAKAPANTADNADLAASPSLATEHHSYEWSFQIVGGDPETGADKTEVTLTRDGAAKVVGVYEGHCSVLGTPDVSWPLAQNELTGVICWWAGAGDEAGVFAENGKYIVKHGTLEEGDADTAGTRGSYETLYTL